jgi:predicted Zn-dependent protease
MHKKLNVRLILWTFAVLLLAGAGVHVVHQFQVRDNANLLLQQAGRAADKGAYAQAITYFSHYLAYEPDDLKALAQYAEVLDRLPPTTAVSRQRIAVLEQAVRLDPGRHDLRERLAVLLVRLGRHADAARHLEALAAALPARADVEHQLGWCQEALKEFARAEASLRRAIRKSPTQLESYVLLAELLRSRLQRPDEAAEVMDEMVTANPKSPRALLARAHYHRAAGEKAQADADTAGAARLAPNDADVLLATAELARAGDDTAQARATLTRGLKLHPRDRRFYHTLAALDVQAGRRADAMATLRRGLAALPHDGALVPGLAELLIDEGKLDEARPLIARLRKDGGPAGVADYLDARVLTQSGRWAEACELLERLRGRSVAAGWSVQVEMALGQGYGRLGETEESLAAYRRAVQLDGSVALARVGLGAALLEAGKVEEALAELQQVADAAAPPAEVWPLLARVLLVHNLLLPESERAWAALDRALERAGQDTPDAPQILTLRAEALAARGRPEQALASLAGAEAARPKEILVRAALADLACRQGKLDVARAALERARRELGDSLELRLARLRLALALDPVEARTALKEVGEEAPASLSQAERLRFKRQLAVALLRAGDRAGAERLWRQLSAERPRDLQVRAHLLDLALHETRDDAAKTILADIRRIEGPGGALWRAGEAARRLALARRGDRSGLAEARKLLAEAKERRPDWAWPALLEAAIDELAGRWDSAATNYRRALELGERDPAVLARAARLLYQHRLFAAADQAVRVLEQQGPLPRDLVRLAAEITLAHEGGRPRTLALARKAAPRDSRDYRDHLWLARIEAAAGQPHDVAKTLRHAARIAGGIPDVWVALVRHLARTGQRKQAEEALGEAARRLPPARADLGLARCEEALGRVGRAEALYRKAVAARPRDFIALDSLADFYRRADELARAAPHLRTLIDPRTPAPEAYVVRARRALAIDLAAAAADSAALEEALALLERNARVRGRSRADEVARAFVLATRPERRAEALRLLEAIPDRQRLSAGEQFLLARAYEALGDDAQANDILLGVLALDGEEPQFLAHRTRALIRQGALDEAGRTLSQLERLEPQSPRSRSLREALRKATAAAGSDA